MSEEGENVQRFLELTETLKVQLFASSVHMIPFKAPAWSSLRHLLTESPDKPSSKRHWHLPVALIVHACLTSHKGTACSQLLGRCRPMQTSVLHNRRESAKDHSCIVISAFDLCDGALCP